MRELCRLRRSEGYGACDDDKQEKTPALLLRRRGHNHPQCGRFERWNLTLIRRLTSLIDAEFRRRAEKRRCCRGFSDAIAK